MAECDAELCPMWDGDTCRCETFGFDRDDLPTSGTFSVTWTEEDGHGE